MRSVRLFLALTLAAIGAAGAKPMPNTTDLGNFKGIYHGSAKVTISDTVSHQGGAIIRASNPSSRTLLVTITAWVRGGTDTAAIAVPIDNQLAFNADGTMRGKELVPGVVVGRPFQGKYGATSDRINFSGHFHVSSLGSQPGSFSGFVTKTTKGDLRVTYSVFVGDSTTASYSYTYAGHTGKPKK
jgi:hypothetical protein